MKALRTIFAFAVLVWLPQAAAACSTCYGAADSPMTKGMNNGILVLLGFVGLMYVGFGKLFLDFRKRSKKLEDARPRLRLIHGEKR
jgi:hypothetical protein